MSDAADLQSVPGPVFFDRRELDLILRVYGRMVAAGEWRDYAMVGHRDVAEFAVFRRSGDTPLYRIEKRPALRLKQGQWAVIGEGGLVLRREAEGMIALAATEDFQEGLAAFADRRPPNFRGA